MSVVTCGVTEILVAIGNNYWRCVTCHLHFPKLTSIDEHVRQKHGDNISAASVGLVNSGSKSKNDFSSFNKAARGCFIDGYRASGGFTGDGEARQPIPAPSPDVSQRTCTVSLEESSLSVALSPVPAVVKINLDDPSRERRPNTGQVAAISMGQTVPDVSGSNRLPDGSSREGFEVEDQATSRGIVTASLGKEISSVEKTGHQPNIEDSRCASPIPASPLSGVIPLASGTGIGMTMEDLPMGQSKLDQQSVHQDDGDGVEDLEGEDDNGVSKAMLASMLSLLERSLESDDISSVFQTWDTVSPEFFEQQLLNHSDLSDNLPENMEDALGELADGGDGVSEDGDVEPSQSELSGEMGTLVSGLGDKTNVPENCSGQVGTLVSGFGGKTNVPGNSSGGTVAVASGLADKTNVPGKSSGGMGKLTSCASDMKNVPENVVIGCLKDQSLKEHTESQQAERDRGGLLHPPHVVDENSVNTVSDNLSDFDDAELESSLYEAIEEESGEEENSDEQQISVSDPAVIKAVKSFMKFSSTQTKIFDLMSSLLYVENSAGCADEGPSTAGVPVSVHERLVKEGGEDLSDLLLDKADVSKRLSPLNPPISSVPSSPTKAASIRDSLCNRTVDKCGGKRTMDTEVYKSKVVHGELSTSLSHFSSQRHSVPLPMPPLQSSETGKDSLTHTNKIPTSLCSTKDGSQRVHHTEEHAVVIPLPSRPFSNLEDTNLSLGLPSVASGSNEIKEVCRNSSNASSSLPGQNQERVRDRSENVFSGRSEKLYSIGDDVPALENVRQKDASETRSRGLSSIQNVWLKSSISEILHSHSETASVSQGMVCQSRGAEDSKVVVKSLRDMLKRRQTFRQSAAKKIMDSRSSTQNRGPKAGSLVKQLAEPKAKHVCSVCDKSFSTPQALQRHAKFNFYSSDQHKCKVCHEKFHSLSVLSVHVYRQHDRLGNQTCLVCRAKFSSTRALVTHVQMHQRDEAEKCGPSALNKARMRSKYRQCKKCRAILPNKSRTVASHVCAKGKKCRQCGMEFPTMSTYQVHMASHQGRMFQCDICAAFFKNKTVMEEHRLTHPRAKQKFLCQVCGQRFARQAQLDKHVKTHSKKKKEKPTLTCEECNKVYICRRSLTRHMKVTHQGVKDYRYKCTLCEDQFFNSWQLRNHMSWQHFGEKPLMCEHCGKGFVCWPTLVRHLRKEHTGARPYKCRFCPDAFVEKKHLDMHEAKTHTFVFPHVCGVCGKGFVLRSYLRSHELTHTQHRPHQCHLCGACFSKASHLTRHTETCRKRHEAPATDSGVA